MKNNINILVVDDEKTIVDVIEVYLKKEGYTVFTASNGTEALKIFNDIITSNDNILQKVIKK